MRFVIGDLCNKNAKNAKNAVLGGGVRCLVGSDGGFVVVSRFHSKRNPTSSGIYGLENPSPCPLPFQKKERESLAASGGPLPPVV